MTVSAGDVNVADAGVAMMESYNRNLVAYKETHDARVFRYDGPCFATALEIFNKMSVPAYEHLRTLFKGLLPSSRRIQTVVNRHQHQPGGVLRASIRDMAAFVFNSGLTSNEKWAASRGNIAFDGMTIQADITWQTSTGKLMGLADADSDYDGPTLQQRLLERANDLAALAALDEGDDAADE